MAGNLLDPEQRRQIEALAASESNEFMRRRAQILLLYDDGLATTQVALAAGRSRGRSRFWRRQFWTRGMSIFPTPGPASTLSQDQEGNLMTIPPAPEPAAPAPSGQPSNGVAEEAPFDDRSQKNGEAPVKNPASPDSTEVPQGPAEISKIPARPNESPPAPKSPPDPFSSLKGLKAPGLLPTDTLAEAGRKVLRFQFAEMLRNEAGTRLGEDIEALHDMRVATRRMRAAVEIFGEAYRPKAIQENLKGLRATGRTLGRARDLDVFMEKARRYQDTLPEERRQGLAPLLETWEEQRSAARADLVDYLDSQEYQDFKRKFYTFVATPGAGTRKLPKGLPTPTLVREIAPMLIYTRLAGVRAFAPMLAGASIEQLHGLRIEFKKLRYTVEFFKEVLGEESKAVINDLKSLQDHLGDLNDAQVATQILSDFLARWDPAQAGLPIDERQNPEPVVAYLAYQHAERFRLMTTFQEAWACFDRPEFRRNLALAVSVL